MIRRVIRGIVARALRAGPRQAGALTIELFASATVLGLTDNLLNSNLGLGLAAQGGGALPTDNLDLEFDRGNSDLAVRHTFVMSGVAILPAGFSFSGVLRATSGAYFTASGTTIDYDGDGIASRRPRSARSGTSSPDRPAST